MPLCWTLGFASTWIWNDSRSIESSFLWSIRNHSKVSLLTRVSCRGGLEQNPAEASRLFRLAAEQGNPIAQWHLGLANGGLSPDQAERELRSLGFFSQN